jgi:hypothetical protein
MSKARLEKGIKQLKQGFENCYAELDEYERGRLHTLIDSLVYHLNYYDKCQAYKEKKELEESEVSK